jgi:sigma-E factor negative regulatory protein RseC
MIEETATVAALDGQYAWVETERRSTCNACAANRGCGTATLAKVLGRRRTRVQVLNPLRAQVGESVVIGIPEDALVRGSLLLYVTPLAGLMAGGALGGLLSAQYGFESEALSVFGGLAGLVFAGGWLRRRTRSMAADARYQPVVLRRAYAPASVTIQAAAPRNI